MHHTIYKRFKDLLVDCDFHRVFLDKDGLANESETTILNYEEKIKKNEDIEPVTMLSVEYSEDIAERLKVSGLIQVGQPADPGQMVFVIVNGYHRTSAHKRQNKPFKATIVGGARI